MQAYSTPERAADPHALPDLEVFELTSEEVVMLDEDLVYDYMRRHEFRLAGLNSTVRFKMVTAILAETGITGGFFYQYCFPGCLPDSYPVGPFATRAEAIAAQHKRRQQNDNPAMAS